MPDQLQQAITDIKSGDRQKGRQLLVDLLKVNPQNEAAWLWLSSVVDTDERRCYCLTQVLKLNPHNELAQRGLERLKPKNQTEANAITLPRPQRVSPTPIQSSPVRQVQPPQLNPVEDKQTLGLKTPVGKEAEVNEASKVKLRKLSSTQVNQPVQSRPHPTVPEVKDNSSLGLGFLGAIFGLVMSLVLWGFIINQFSMKLYMIDIGLMAPVFGGLIGGMVRLLGQGNRSVFGVMAALVSFVGYFLGSYLTYSFAFRGSWVPLLDNLLSEENFNNFVLLTMVTFPITVILSLTSMILSFVIAFRRQHRKRVEVEKPVGSSKGWIALFGLIAIVGCAGILVTLSGGVNMDNLMLGLIIVLFGLFPLAGAYFNWDWFMNNRRARLFVMLLGRNGARVFYALLGIGFVLLGLLIIADTVDPFATY